MTSPAAQARASAARVVAAVLAGRSLDTALDECFAALAPSLARERPLIQEMSYGTLRWWLALEPMLGSLLDRPLKDQDLRALLGIGLYQLLFMRVAVHAAIKETVDAAQAMNKLWAKGFVNAVLRRAQREESSLRTRPTQDENCAHPPWLVKELRNAWPQHWRSILEANNARAPLTLRVNLRRNSRTDYLDRLSAADLSAHTHPEIESAIVVETPVPVERLPGFGEGLVSVQDAAAQLAAPLLAIEPGMRVLDACAAPGGKASHLLEQVPDLKLTALDIDQARLDRVRENFERLGVRGHVVVGDAARPTDWWDGVPYDRILLDAPCSATGVIRRHPDIRLHRTPSDIERLAETQGRLLDALWPLLAPGGKLLYVTCSVLPRENSQVLGAFRTRAKHVQLLSPDHPALDQYGQRDENGCQVLPGPGDMDGFYYAGLVREGA